MRFHLFSIFAIVWFAATPAAGQRLIANRLFGGSGSDQPSAIATDPQGNIYVAGQTTSTDLPAARGFQSLPKVLPLALSVDGGTTFRNIAIPSVSNVIAVASSADGSTIYAGTPRGVERSDDGGATWSVGTPGIPSTPQVLALDPSNPKLVYAGTPAGFYRSTDGGNSWTLAPSFPVYQPSSAIFYQIVVDPLDVSTVWACLGNTPNPTGLFVSHDRGVTWTAVTIPPLGFSLYSVTHTVAPDPQQSGTVFASGDALPLLKSVDGGQTWNSLAAIYASMIAIDPSNDTTLYAVTGFGLRKSTDGGATFAATGLDATVRSIAIDPANPARLYAGADQALYTSGDGGATWSRTSIRAVSQMAVTPGRVLVGAQVPGEVYVAKLSPDLSQVFWSTYLGGSSYHSVSGLTVDAAGNAYVVGTTASTDFPVTAGALESSGTAFVAKIAADGAQLAASTYFGGGLTFPQTIAVDAAGAIYVAGSNSGAGFATTAGAYQRAAPGPCTRGADPGGFVPSSNGAAFVSKLSADLSTLLYSTLLTGTCGSSIFAMRVDGAGIATVAGGTYSLDFPTTGGAMMTTAPGSDESGFLAQLSSDGGSLLYSTFLGGGPTSEAHALLTDAAGNWIVAGGGSPATTPGAAHVKGSSTCAVALLFGVPVPRPPTMGEEAFVMVFNAHSASPSLVATVGGPCMDEADSVALDAGGNIWIAGATFSQGFPSRALVGGLGAASGGFVAAFSPAGDAVLSSGPTGNVSRLAASGGRIVGSAWTAGPPELQGLVTYTTALALFDAVGAPPMEIDGLSTYAGNKATFVVAPGEVVRIVGRHFGPAQEVAGSVANSVVGDSIAGLQVTFDGVAAPLLSLQDQSIAAVAPFEVRASATTVQVKVNGRPVSNAVPFGVNSRNPELLLVVNEDGSVNSADHPARMGRTIAMYVTGLGVETPGVSDGSVRGAPSPAPPVLVGPNFNFNSVLVQPSYVGAAVGMVAGIVQVNVQVPQFEATGQLFLNGPQFGSYVYVSR